VAILACTANALASETEICLSAGMDDCMVKPVELLQLLKKLDQWLPIPDESMIAGAAPVERNRVAAAAGPLDATVLAATLGADPALQRNLLASFRRVNDQDAAALRSAVAAGDLPAVAHAAHRMHGASRTIGAVGYARICERLEGSGREGDLTAVSFSMEDLHRELTRLDSYFDSIDCGKQEAACREV